MVNHPKHVVYFPVSETAVSKRFPFTAGTHSAEDRPDFHAVALHYNPTDLSLTLVPRLVCHGCDVKPHVLHIPLVADNPRRCAA